MEQETYIRQLKRCLRICASLGTFSFSSLPLLPCWVKVIVVPKNELVIRKKKRGKRNIHTTWTAQEMFACLLGHFPCNPSLSFHAAVVTICSYSTVVPRNSLVIVLVRKKEMRKKKHTTAQETRKRLLGHFSFSSLVLLPCCCRQYL